MDGFVNALNERQSKWIIQKCQFQKSAESSNDVPKRVFLENVTFVCKSSMLQLNISGAVYWLVFDVLLR